MAIKDLSPTDVGNMLVFIKLFNDYAADLVKRAVNKAERNDKIGKDQVGRGVTIVKNGTTGGQALLQAWFNKYIKPTAPAAGTATFSSTYTGIADYQNNFYVIRVALVGVAADPATLAALDAWWAKMTVSASFKPSR
jgi:hypothetical protein